MKLIAAAAAILLTSASANAADAIVYPEPAPVEVVNAFSWTGGYVGLNAGYAWGKSATNIDWYASDEFYDSFHYKPKLSGFIGGVQAGYNWQFDSAVFGIETDIQGTSLKKSTSDVIVDPLNAPGVVANVNLETKINWLGTTRVRLGYLPSERLLAYVTGGLAYGGVKASFTDYYGFDTSTSKTKAGYAVGAGLEYALADNWTVKTEYLFADLGNIKQTIFDDGDYRDVVKHKFQMHTVRVGLNYKF